MKTDNLERSIGRLEGKVDLVVGQMTELKSAFQLLEAGRLSRLENTVATLTAKVSIIAAAVPIVVSVLIFLAEKYLF